jgi:hypothetical protein
LAMETAEVWLVALQGRRETRRAFIAENLHGSGVTILSSYPS